MPVQKMKIKRKYNSRIVLEIYAVDSVIHLLNNWGQKVIGSTP